MFMFQSVSKYIFGSGSKETVAEIAQGQLYLVRPNSPRGVSELIFKDAAASIRRTSKPFHSQLVIQRAFEEGEEELLADEEDDGNPDAGALSDPDEKAFPLDEQLEFRFVVRSSGETAFCWTDLTGTPGDRYEFVCSITTEEDQLEGFFRTALGCQFERKHEKPSTAASDEELALFVQEPLPPSSATSENPFIQPDTDLESESAPGSPSEPASPSRMSNRSEDADIAALEKELEDMDVREAAKTSKPPEEVIEFFGGTEMASVTAELHFYDFQTGAFTLQDDSVAAKVVDISNWEYQLQITSEETDWMAQLIDSNSNPVFNFEFMSFIFNHYTPDGSAYSWLLRFPSAESLEVFQRAFMQAMWEHMNELKWSKAKAKDQEYVLEAFEDTAMVDISEGEEDEEEEEEREARRSESEEEQDDDKGAVEEEDDGDESGDEDETKQEKGVVNSQLAVGYKHDRSFVVRGSSIGVFKHTDDNRLKLMAHISEIKTPGGKKFDPKKVMLHESDTNLILQDTTNANSLFQMDLETGKVVEEWKVHDHIPVTNFAPNSKFSQMTGEKTFLGLSNKAVFQIDPRLSGSKLVNENMKQYATKTAFSAIATTENDHIAIASEKGDIRLFDRLGVNAKTTIPALGDAIHGLDVSANGRWVLATTKTYLLLIDSLQQTGKFEGKLGFERSFPADSKPVPRRLALTPNHVAQFQFETGSPISFTPAKFNTGVDSEETTIIAATGPFVITWSLKKVIAGRRDPYVIKRYSEEVKADNFKFGSDKNMIVALPNEVNMVAKQALKKPTRESIAALPTAHSRRSLRKTNLWRTDIVDSPY